MMDNRTVYILYISPTYETSLLPGATFTSALSPILLIMPLLFTLFTVKRNYSYCRCCSPFSR